MMGEDYDMRTLIQDCELIMSLHHRIALTQCHRHYVSSLRELFCEVLQPIQLYNSLLY